MSGTILSAVHTTLIKIGIELDMEHTLKDIIEIM